MTTNIDREELFQLVRQEKWGDFLNLIGEISKNAASDELVMTAAKTFEDSFFEKLDKNIEVNDLQKILNKIFLLHKGGTYKISKERFTRVVVELVKIRLEEKASLVDIYDSYAKFCPENETCAEIIERYEESLPRNVEHSQSNHITVTENREIAYEDNTIKLFKAPQEMEFFMGVREAFPMFFVYPNVALSCVISFDMIKDKLSGEERSFFFKGIIDCVVFDQFNEYKPTKFYEIDSSYHDRPDQKQKDRYKDKILGLAGQKIYRIRKKLDSQGRNEFMKLVLELENLESAARRLASCNSL